MRYRILLIILTLSLHLSGQTQPDKKALADSILPNEPIYYINNIQVNKGVLSYYNPNEIAAVEVLKDSSAIKNAGEKGKNGVIYITTKVYARKKYWKYFCSKSNDFAKAVPNIEEEDEVCYILNGKILESNFEGDLFFIDDSNFVELKVIDKNELKTNYSIKNKKWGVVIKTNRQK
jgi:hypothetical protein